MRKKSMPKCWEVRTFVVLAAVSLTVAVGLGACGGGADSTDDEGWTFGPDAASTSGGTTAGTTGGTSSGDFDSSVADDREASDLSEDESERICEEAFSWAQTRLSEDRLCLLQAHVAVSIQRPSSDAEARRACSDAKDECEGIFEEDDSGCIGVTTDECDAEVATIEQCYEDRVESIQRALAELPTCPDVEASFYEDFSGASIIPETSPACDRLQKKCPEYYGEVLGGL